jgi:cyclophilin family peptidyl-prolyl cis-trans isomerase/HEAT repeat protein
MAFRAFVFSWLAIVATIPRVADSQSLGPTRFAILQAEDRRAPTPADLSTIRAGVRSGDAQTVRVAIRALGRLERASLVPDLLPSLKHPLPEVRAEAANALGQALQGVKRDKAAAPPPSGLGSPAAGVIAALISRLNVEADSGVRGAICETLGRVAATPDDVMRASAALVSAGSHEMSIDGRLGIASGFEALVRLHRREQPPGEEAIALLRAMVSLTPPGFRVPPDPARNVRVRRVALEALVTAGAVDDATLDRAIGDPDPQVRRLAMRAAPTLANAGERLTRGLTDSSPMVRIEALHATRDRGADAMCAAAVIGTGDGDTHVVLAALDQLAGCAGSADAIAVLEHTVADPSDADKPRAWHRAAHALVALAAADPTRGAAALAQFTGSPTWQLRMYGARAAATLKDHRTLETLAADDDDNVREAAIDGLVKVMGHAADAVYVGELSRSGNQVLRAAAAALAGTPNAEAATPALKAAAQRLAAEGRDNSHDARDAIARTLTALGAEPGRPRGPALVNAAARSGSEPPAASRLDADDLRRLASPPRARVTIRGVGRFELLLFTSEAPASVLRFVRLAESGYYNGLTFHRVVPNFVIQGGSPGANEYIGDATFMRDEVGLWPHVRGAVGISTRGRDTGDGQLFIDLVDNPRLNHDYTVFAQALNGLDVVDRILEGDIIERVEILRP